MLTQYTVVWMILATCRSITVESTVLIRVKVLSEIRHLTDCKLNQKKKRKGKNKICRKRYLPLVPSIALRDRKLLLGISCSRLR